MSGGTARATARIPGFRIAHLYWSARGDLFLAADRGGTERWQIYVRRSGSERIEPFAVTDGERAQHFLGRQAGSSDGGQIVFAGNPREPSDVDVVLADAKSGEQRPLVTAGAWHRDRGWSPDGRKVLVTRVHDNADQDLLIVDVESRRIREIPRAAREGKMQNVPAGWLADGRVVAFTDLDSEHLWLAAIDPETGEPEVLDRPDWSVESAMTSDDGQTVAWTVNVAGCSSLRWARDGSRHEHQTNGVVYDLLVSRDGNTISYLRSSFDAPGQRWVVDVESGEATLVYESRPDAFDYAEFDPPTRIRIPAPEGAIPAFMFRPRGTNAPTPAVLFIHGGPEGQARGEGSPIVRSLLERGVSIVIPNIHGSTGYGKSWQTAIHGDFGGVDLRDLRAVAEWMTSCGDFDAERLAVFGGSYGGYAALLCATRFNERWRCAVDWFGWSDLAAALDHAEPNWQRFMRRWLGPLANDRAELARRSPITYMDDLRCPLLILQGENDMRVKKAESDRIVERLQQRGREVDYLLFPGEGHGLTKRANVDVGCQRTVDFLSEHLGVMPTSQPTFGARRVTSEGETAEAERP